MTYVYALLVLSMVSTAVWGYRCLCLIQAHEGILELYPKRTVYVGDGVYRIKDGTYWKVVHRHGQELTVQETRADGAVFLQRPSVVLEMDEVRILDSGILYLAT